MSATSLIVAWRTPLVIQVYIYILVKKTKSYRKPLNQKDVDRLAERQRFFELERFAGLADKMKEELPSYLAAVAMIKPLNERLDEDDKDTFDNEAWWSAHLGDLRAWADALCAVLCHVPNSCPPERAFSILNNSIGDDQTSALAYYKKAMVMLQYNKRGR